jgi:predicted DNA-binding protein
MATKTKDKVIFVRSDRQLDKRIRKAAQLLDRPAAQIVREAIKAELDRLSEQFPELKAA